MPSALRGSTALAIACSAASRGAAVAGRGDGALAVLGAQASVAARQAAAMTQSPGVVDIDLFGVTKLHENQREWRPTPATGIFRHAPSRRFLRH